MNYVKNIMLMAAMLLATNAFAAPATSYIACDQKPVHKQMGMMSFNYVPCFTTAAPGDITTVIIVDQQTNQQRAVQGPATYYADCAASGVCVIWGSTLYAEGTIVGESPAGWYRVDHDHYLGLDIYGKSVSYKKGTGPRWGGDPAGVHVAEPGEVGLPMYDPANE